MPKMTRFLIKRLDAPGSAESVILEAEGLTIGRAPGNDLILNNRAVSRTHAGIKEIDGEYWLFNLSGSNGTFLNGSLADRIPLADGDVVRIGPYFLRVQYVQGTLSITVKMELEVQSVLAKATQEEGVILGGISPSIPKKSVTIGGSRRISGTGFLTSITPPPDEEALRIFWEKRKREAGKIGAQTPLRPKSGRGLGKTQFNWGPTFDLKSLWRKSAFAWGAVAVTFLSLACILIYMDAYSPASLSEFHATRTPSAKKIAEKATEGSCTACHGLLPSMETSCTQCHSTPAFDPSISKAHVEADIGCIGCHTEHRGQAYQPGAVTAGSCVSCHNDEFPFKGKVLGIPHGGKVGYPVVNGKWDWTGLSPATWQKKKLPLTPSDFTSAEQFHLVHLSGKKEGRLNCKDCHAVVNSVDARFRTSAKASCDRCHGSGLSASPGPECASCHQQHGSSRNLVASIRKSPTEPVQQARFENVAQSGFGGETVRRHNEGSVTLRSLWKEIGGIGWLNWGGVALILIASGFVVLLRDSGKHRKQIAQSQVTTEAKKVEPGRSIDLELLAREGPAYPHPVVDPVLCIGCHACVEACPHDVLAIVDGISVPVAPDQCMEDTGCEAECPTSPKACVVINTKKIIPPRKVPRRDSRFMTDVQGIYLIGDVSGVPLIKNAVNEGADVIEQIAEALKLEGPNPAAKHDLLIVGTGPAGLSAAVLAKQRGLNFVAVEQDIVASTIQNYPAGKYVFYKPDTVTAKGGIPVPGPGGQKEDLVNSWLDVMRRNNIVVNEEETCKGIKNENGSFRVITEKGKTAEQVEYLARKVVLAIGTRGAPMKLGVSGEDLTFVVQPSVPVCSNCTAPRTPGIAFCTNCGQKFAPGPRPEHGCCTECGVPRKGRGPCANCGAKLEAEQKEEAKKEPERFTMMEFNVDMLKVMQKGAPEEKRCTVCNTVLAPDKAFCSSCGTPVEKAPERKCWECGTLYQESHRFCSVCGERLIKARKGTREETKVKYKLSNPDDYIGKKCIVVGGGNSAIEAAVDLCGFRRVGDRIIFIRDNEVTLLVRSDFKGDLKLGNKINVFDCIDAGKIKVIFGAAIKELRQDEAVIINVRTKEQIDVLKNDYVFALIGGEKPTKFLEQIGIKIG